MTYYWYELKTNSVTFINWDVTNQILDINYVISLLNFTPFFYDLKYEVIYCKPLIVFEKMSQHLKSRFVVMYEKQQ